MDQVGLQPQEQPLTSTVELICPNCGAECLADPASFPDGRTVAACSACDGRMVLVKDATGALSVGPMPDAASAFAGLAAPGGASAGALGPEADHEADRKAASPESVSEGPASFGAAQSDPTHPVVCPKCLRRYRVPWSKIPKQGAWVNCPTCQERFIIKLEDTGFLDFQPDTPPKPGGGASRPKASNYLYRPGEDAPGELLVTVLDPVTPKARRYWGVGLILVILAIFAAEAAILRSSWMSARGMGEEIEVVIPPPPVYGEAALASDLRTIQESTVSSVTLDRLIEYTGGESRVFKYAAAVLAPETCEEITSVSMRSSAPASGLSLRASCLD